MVSVDTAVGCLLALSLVLSVQMSWPFFARFFLLLALDDITTFPPLLNVLMGANLSSTSANT